MRSTVLKINRNKKIITVQNDGKTYEERYDKLILSPGAEPIKPCIPGIALKQVFTLRNMADTFRIRDFIETYNPKRAVIVGGGYIGVEMAENFSRAGIAVTIVELLDQLIAPLDYDMACDVHRHLCEKGVQLLLRNGVNAIRHHGNALKVMLNDGEIDTDMLVLAVGVRPESTLAQNAGLITNERGSIIVSESMLTNDSDIYAVGDAVEVIDFVTGQKGFIPLAGPANKQGRIAADNIAGIKSRYCGTQGSSVLRVFDLTVAATGINEKTAKCLGLNYDKSFTYSASHAGYYPGAANISVKTIYEKETGKILGAQLVGRDGVDKRADIFASAIRAGMTAFDLTQLELCYAPPYSSAKDPVNMAGFVIENILAGRVKTFHWHDIGALAKMEGITLLDVRTPAEYARGAITRFLNIPVDELRERLDELDPTKPIYVACQVGLRGYIAARLLIQRGFDVYNLSGGYRLYDSIFGNAEYAKKD